MLLVNTDYISGKELEMLGLVKGIAILMVARWALCDLLQWVPADVAAESYVLPWLTPSAFFSLFGK